MTFSVELIYRLGSVPFAWLSIWILSFLLPVFGHSVAGWPGRFMVIPFFIKEPTWRFEGLYWVCIVQQSMG